MTKNLIEGFTPSPNPAIVNKNATVNGDNAGLSARKRRVARSITRADVLAAVYDACPSLSRAQAREVFEMTLEELVDCFDRNEAVKLRSFGAFCVRTKRGRVGRNPKTGVEAQITPRRVVTFKPSPALIGMINGHAVEGASE